MLQPRTDWVLIECEPFDEKKGGIIVLAQHQRVRHGTVRAVGPGRYKEGMDVRVPVDVQVGERVAFFREHMEHQGGKMIQTVLHELGDSLALIRWFDLLGKIDKGTVVDV